MCRATDDWPCCVPAALIHLPAYMAWLDDIKIIQPTFTCVHMILFIYFSFDDFLGCRGQSAENNRNSQLHPARVPVSWNLPECGIAEPGHLDGKEGCLEGKWCIFLLKNIGSKETPVSASSSGSWPDRVLKPGSRGLCRFNDLFFPMNQILHLNYY